MTTQVDLNGAWDATAAGTTAGATATKAAVAGKSIVVTHVSGHVDADSIITLNDAGVIIAQWKIDVSVEGFSFAFSGCWMLDTAAAATAVIASSTADCQVNMLGFTLP